jgi:hypothetical protein
VGQIVVATERGLHDLDSGRIEFADRAVTSLSPASDWAIIDRRELWMDRDGWRQVASSPELDLTCIAANGAVYVGTSEAHLLALAGDSLTRINAFDQVEGRDEWFTPWGGPPDVRSLAVGNGKLYVNVHVGGIVGGDGDSIWEPTLEISSDIHEVRMAGERIVAACAVGLAESGDGGSAWSYDDEGLHAAYARAIAAADEVLFMSVSRGPGGGDAAIYRRPLDGTGPFARCDLPSFTNNIDTGCLDANANEVAFGTRSGDLFHSTDRGNTWEKHPESLPPVNYVRFVA